MSNEEIITKSAISAGIFSEEEAAAYIMNGLRLPIHTFAEWKRMGYSVKKGQHAALTCQLWKYTDKPGKAAREAAEADGKDAPETDPHFYMTKAHLFHALQVEKSKR